MCHAQRFPTFATEKWTLEILRTLFSPLASHLKVYVLWNCFVSGATVNFSLDALKVIVSTIIHLRWIIMVFNANMKFTVWRSYHSRDFSNTHRRRVTASSAKDWRSWRNVKPFHRLALARLILTGQLGAIFYFCTTYGPLIPLFSMYLVLTNKIIQRRYAVFFSQLAPSHQMRTF